MHAYRVDLRRRVGYWHTGNDGRWAIARLDHRRRGRGDRGDGISDCGGIRLGLGAGDTADSGHVGSGAGGWVRRERGSGVLFPCQCILLCCSYTGFGSQ